jgi:hypothetical protein
MKKKDREEREGRFLPARGYKNLKFALCPHPRFCIVKGDGKAQ